VSEGADPDGQITQEILGEGHAGSSLNGYGASVHGHERASSLVAIGLAFLGGLLLARLVGKRGQ
jgi:hypothetical protein